jgi:uncharacterized protein YtpQ (UPF0354 family)
MATSQSLTTFMQQIVVATKAAGFIVEKHEACYLFLNVHGHSLRLNLETAFSAYQNEPRAIDEIIKIHLNVLHTLPKIDMPSFDGAALKSFMPILQTAQWLKDHSASTPGGLYNQPFWGDLVIVYIFDQPTARAYVSNAMVERTDKFAGDPKRLHTYALDNLRRQVKGYDVTAVGSMYQLMLTCQTHEGYAAMHVLLPEVMDAWARRIPGTMLLGIPNRDFIIAFSDRHPAGVQPIAGQVKKDAVTREYALTSHLLTWRDGQIRPYQQLH